MIWQTPVLEDLNWGGTYDSKARNREAWVMQRALPRKAQSREQGGVVEYEVDTRVSVTVCDGDCIKSFGLWSVDVVFLPKYHFMFFG